MPAPDYILLYVTNPAASAEFYAALLECKPIEASPTFALFVLPSGVKLGLWARQTVEPPVTSPGVAGELAFAVNDEATVRAWYNDWQARGIAMAQTPLQLDFGFTFVALDPDGHRLRVFSPAQA